ncbi:MAG: hypothetical protein EH225_06300 [Calditrichaeota bacterium]|nr:oligosaccharide flippase family protein [Calditrichota bacterium]RQW04013.1 MAG: hypothetical protein EH225_06300 [Calditrichota bacterium]
MELNQQQIRQYFNFLKGSSRTDKAKKHIFFLFILHAFNLGLTLLLVPITLKVLNPGEYGIWLTIISITTWFISLDFGLGNGLRNKLAEALAKNDEMLAKTYVSTAYLYLSSLVALFYVIFLIVNPFISWSSILNVSQNLSVDINKVVFIVFSFFFLNFILKLVTIIAIADQKPAVNGLLTLFINLLTVIALAILAETDYANLLYMGAISSAIPAIIYIMASIRFFSREYKSIRPSLRHIAPGYSKSLLSLGFRFFVIQVASLIIFATDNVIITQIFSPSEVTVYNVAYKYFTITSLVFGVILTPFWSAYTEAFARSEMDWIRNVIRKLIRIWFLALGVVVILVIISEPFYRFWVGTEIVVPFILSVLMAIFVSISMWNNIFAYFLNGVGKIQIQVYNAIFMGLLNIPLSIYFAGHLGLGISGVILATIFCLLPSMIWAPLQYHKIVHGKARGIWNR